MRAAVVVETVAVDARVDAVWAAVSDPTAYARWSPEATGVHRLGGSEDSDGSDATAESDGSRGWDVGDRFVGTNRVWFPWFTVCTVVRVDPSRAFGFDVDFGPLPVSRWEYELEPLPHGRTRVRERWTDRRVGPLGVLVRPSGLLVGRGRDAVERNRSTMRVTLDRLRAELESEAQPGPRA